MAVPTRDKLLVPFSTNFNARISTAPATYLLSPAQATQYTSLHDPYIAAAAAASAPGQKSRSLVAARNSLKQSLLPYARELYAFIQANTGVADSAKTDVGVVIRKKEPTPLPAPSAAPSLTVKSVYGRQFTLKIKDASGTRRGRPPATTGAQLFSFVGETPPAGGAAGWISEGTVTRNTVVVAMPSTLAPGTRVWFTCCWFNARGTGPSCTPVGSGIGFDGAEPVAV
jgi:hypothetical protein